MTSRPPLLTLLASLLVHGAALALVFVFASGESRPSALLVDLSAQEALRDEGAPRQERAGSSRPIERAAASAGARPSRSLSPSPPSSAAASPSTVAPRPLHSEPAPEWDMTPPRPPEPRQPEPPVAVVSAREDAPDGVARNSATPSTAEVRPESAGAGTERTDMSFNGGVGRRATQGSSAPGESSGGSGTGVALAPAGSPGGEPGSEYGVYLRNFRRRIVESLRYPPAARRQGLKGTVQLEIFIKPDGAISTVSVTGSSSHPLLDEAALEAVRSLAPQPFPAGLVPRLLRVRLPVVFDLQ